MSSFSSRQAAKAAKEGQAHGEPALPRNASSWAVVLSRVGIKVAFGELLRSYAPQLEYQAYAD